MRITEVPAGWWQAAVRKVPFAVACVDLDGYFVFANDSWCRMVGYSAAELRDLRWHDITRIVDIGGDQLQVEKLRSGEIDEYYLEKTYIRKGGKEIAIRLFAHRYPMQGELECYLACAQPIEDLPQVEILQQQITLLAERLEDFEARWAWAQHIPTKILRWWPVIVSIVAAVWIAITWLIARLSTE